VVAMRDRGNGANGGDTVQTHFTVIVVSGRISTLPRLPPAGRLGLADHSVPSAQIMQ